MNNRQSENPANASSVTVVVTRRVMPRRELEYENWITEVSHIVRQFQGLLGATVQGPTGANEYHVIFRFDTIENLRQWENSKERIACIAKLDGIVDGGDRIGHYTGLEVLFDADAVPIQRHKMVLVLMIIVFLMILTLRPIVVAVLPGLPPPAQLFVTVAIQVIAMTYAVMPGVTRWLGRWLHR